MLVCWARTGRLLEEEPIITEVSGLSMYEVYLHAQDSDEEARFTTITVALVTGKARIGRGAHIETMREADTICVSPVFAIAPPSPTTKHTRLSAVIMPSLWEPLLDLEATTTGVEMRLGNIVLSDIARTSSTILYTSLSTITAITQTPHGTYKESKITDLVSQHRYRSTAGNHKPAPQLAPRLTPLLIL